MTLQWVWITMRQPEVGWEAYWMGCLWTSNYVTRERMISTVTACVCSNKYVQNVILNQIAYPVIIPTQFGSNQVTKMLVFIINLVSCGREYHKSFIETLVTSWCLQLLTFRCGRLGVACFRVSFQWCRQTTWLHNFLRQRPDSSGLYTPPETFDSKEAGIMRNGNWRGATHKMGSHFPWKELHAKQRLHCWM